MTTQKKVDLATWLASKGKEDASNKVTSLSSSSTDTQYPSAKLVYDELADKLDASDVPTKTSDLTNDGDGTNAFLTSHQDISGKEDTSNKVTSLSDSSTDTQYPSAKLVYDELADKLDAADVPTKTSDLTNDGDGTNDFVTKSTTSGLIKNDGSIDTSTYLTSHQDISGKEDKSNKVKSTAGWSSTTSDDNYPSEKLVKSALDLKANSADLATVATSGSYADLSNKPTVDTTITDGSTNAVSGNAVYDALALKSDTGHTHAASEVIDSTAHSNLETAANATQAAINTAIDTKIGALLSIELITVVAELPNASASTMNKMYLVAESSSKTNDNYEIFVTVRTGTSGSYSYAWEKVDTARLDLSGYVQKSAVDLEIVNDELILTLD
ncbi:MAG: hypothetical protein K6A34_06045 [Methanobrevibacter sp.]|nr:hypothetical protein [Methanobrevibacter sp.]